MSSPRPQRRRTTHVETLHGELCIYEWTSKTVHALNPGAARVWEMCDGTTTVTGMIAAVQHDEGTPAATLIVQHALAQFERAGLLEPDVVVGAAPVSRRRLLQTIGVAAIPVVTSLVAPPPAAAQSSRSATFNFTGAAQSFVVPAGITVLQVDVVGAQGAGNIVVFASMVGFPGRVQATLPVTPGEVLTIVVGGGGGFGMAGGFNGGGSAGANGNGGGGGASDIRRGGTRLIVAGGGGGAGATSAHGGNGGGLVGASGLVGACGCGGGFGGTQSAGGAGGSCPAAGSPGASGVGGAGADVVGGTGSGGAGGGGGHFGGGGGGGGNCTGGGGAGGGGGSSFADGSATNVVHTQGVNPFVAITGVTLSW